MRVERDAGMKHRMVLVLGGARSGKSSFAQGLAAASGRRICFLATAWPGDEEMEKRIERHREERPEGWVTLELAGGTELPGLPREGDLALMDCFTVYLSNLMARAGLDWPAEEEGLMQEEEVLRRMGEVEAEALELVERVREAASELIVVANEVGMGVVPAYRLGRVFRDLAGRLNQRLAERADEVYLVAAGLPLRLKP